MTSTRRARLVLSAWALCVFAPATFAAPALWLRSAAISPDGKTVAFSYRGGLWRVPAVGGPATPLTVGEAYDTEPVWSPD